MGDEEGHLVLSPSGKVNVQQSSTEPVLNFLDYHRLVNASWPETLVVFLSVVISSFFIFGTLYWLICQSHGDFEVDHLPEMQRTSNFTPCIYHMYNYASCILFSIETQYKVAYGIKATTDECPEAIFVNAVECLIGLVIQGFMSAIIFSKMTKPKLRSNTLLFSKNALLTVDQGVPYFKFRIGDLRENHIFNVSCRAVYVARHTRTREGDVISYQQTLLDLKSDGCKDNMFFNWPLVMSHKITNESPLHGYIFGTNKDRFEVIVVLEGIMQSTGLVTQDMTGYLAEDIVLGREFANMTTFKKDKNEFEIDFSKFDTILGIIK